MKSKPSLRQQYIKTDIMPMTKPVTFLGSSLGDLREFPQEARRNAGFQIDKVQRGEFADDWKPLPTVGSGVREIRIRDEAGAFRVIYVASFPEAVYVLHVFQKKSQKAPVAEMHLARRRYGDLARNRR